MLKVTSTLLLAAGALAVGAPAAGDRSRGGTGTAASLRAAIQSAIVEEIAALKAATPASAKRRVANAIVQLERAQALLESAEGRILPTFETLGRTIPSAHSRDAIASARFERARKEKDKRKQTALMRSARGMLRTALAAKAAALKAVPNEASFGCRVLSKSIGTSSFVLVDRCTTTIDLINLTAEKGDPLGELPADVESGATTTTMPCTFRKSVLSCPAKLDPGAAFVVNTTSVRNETTVAVLIASGSGVEFGKALVTAK